MPGLYTFTPGAQGPGSASDIEILESDLKQMKRLADSMQRYCPLGSDDALKAGYDPSDPTRVDKLTKRVGSLAKQAREIEKGVDLARTAFEQLQASRDEVDRQLPDDEAERRQASVKVVRLLVNSPTNFHTLLRALGVEVTEEIKEALDNALRRGFSDSQADQWLYGSQEDQRRLRTTVQDLQDQLQRLEEDLTIKRDTVDRLYSERDEARKTARDQRDARKTAERETHRVRQGRDRLREEALAAERATRADKLSIDQLKQEKDRLAQQIQQLAQERSDAIARANEAYAELQSHKDELSALRKELSAFKYRQPMVEEADATIKALRDQAAKDREEGAASKQLAQIAEGHNKKLVTENLVLSGQNEKLQRDLAQALQNVTSLEGDRDVLSQQNGALQQELSTARELAAEFRGDKAALEQEISKLRESSVSEQRKTLEDLERAEARAGQAQRSCNRLREEVDGQRQTLRDQVSEIMALRNTSQEREEQLSRQSEAQVQQAATLLRHFSIGTESDIWQGLAQRTLHDVTWLSTQATWHPWRIVPSWSTNKALEVQVDDRSVHAAALDVLAILRSRSAGVKNLLSRLQVLQNGLIDSPAVVSSLAEMLLAAFVEAVQDARLHLMHRLVMWQVALEMFPVAQVQETLGRALDMVDGRVARLAGVIRGWDSGDFTEFSSRICVAYPEMALLGFNRNPPGVMAFSRTRRELWWIDNDQVHQDVTEMKLMPISGDAIHLPLDNEERLKWALTHG
jgi:myosin heavy subunit